MDSWGPAIFGPISLLYRGFPLSEVTSIDVLPSKNQALCKYCTLASKLKHC